MLPLPKHSPVSFPTVRLRDGWFDPEKDEPCISFRDDFDAPRSGGRRHNGTDVVAPIGALVTSMFTGEVIHAGWDTFGGWAVITRSHGRSSHSVVDAYYGHMAQRPHAAIGARVVSGDVLGVVGRSGEGPPGSLIASGSHVHVWVHVDGVAINPHELLSAFFGRDGRLCLGLEDTPDFTETAVAHAKAMCAPTKRSQAEASASFNAEVEAEYVTIFPTYIGTMASPAAIRQLAQRNVLLRRH